MPPAEPTTRRGSGDRRWSSRSNRRSAFSTHTWATRFASPRLDDRDPLSACFDVDDQKIADGFHWDFVVLDTGLTDVRGRVSDGAHTSYIDWRVRSTEPVNAVPVIVSTFPVETNPVLVVNHEMNFGVVAVDPEEGPLDYTFTVNDSIVARDRQLTYQPTSLGMKHVRVVVSDDMNSVVREWDLKVTTVPDNIPRRSMTLLKRARSRADQLRWTAVGRDGMVGKPSPGCARRPCRFSPVD
jgi:hypothetical protein